MFFVVAKVKQSLEVQRGVLFDSLEAICLWKVSRNLLGWCLHIEKNQEQVLHFQALPFHFKVQSCRLNMFLHILRLGLLSPLDLFPVWYCSSWPK